MRGSPNLCVSLPQRIVVGITGATGQIYGIRTLELLDGSEYETHLIYSNAAATTLDQETDHTLDDLIELADQVYSNGEIGAAPASGSFRTGGMIITPCSMKTLSNLAHGNAGNLIVRSGDVTLKERRPLVVMPREKPFNRIHLKNMLELTDAGGIVVPPFPSFYQGISSIDEMVTRTVARSLSQLDVPVSYEEYDGLGSEE